MQTRSKNYTQVFSKKFTVGEVEAAKALVQLKNVVKKNAANTWPSGRPRRSTAGVVNYSGCE